MKDEPDCFSFSSFQGDDTMTVFAPLVAADVLALDTGCSSGPETGHLSGKVTFKDHPVPAGWIQFTPDVAAGGLGQSRVYQVKEGKYDSTKESQPALTPGTYLIRIAGFDGKKLPYF